MDKLFRDYLLQLQNDMTSTLGGIEPELNFIHDSWEREQGGGGISCVLQNGKVFDRAGVNYSYVYGDNLPSSASAQRPELAGRSFKAMGVSSVIHPTNPFIPTAHMNVRLFLATHPDKDPIAWFGGGFDLTPFYIFEEDCIHWHQTARDLCSEFGDEVYPKYQSWADDYFYLKHRKEPRGIGGLFFDDLNERTWGWDLNRCMEFTQAIGQGFLKAYVPIIKERMNHSYNEPEKAFQLLRRGRYVEFNLLWDRGTLFGIQSGGRAESILMSLPPNVSWKYGEDQTHSEEQSRLIDVLHNKSWLAKV